MHISTNYDNSSFKSSNLQQFKFAIVESRFCIDCCLCLSVVQSNYNPFIMLLYSSIFNIWIVAMLMCFFISSMTTLVNNNQTASIQSDNMIDQDDKQTRIIQQHTNSHYLRAILCQIQKCHRLWSRSSASSTFVAIVVVSSSVLDTTMIVQVVSFIDM